MNEKNRNRKKGLGGGNKNLEREEVKGLDGSMME